MYGSVDGCLLDLLLMSCREGKECLIVERRFDKEGLRLHKRGLM
jgi:hypothetical protein